MFGVSPRIDVVASKLPTKLLYWIHSEEDQMMATEGKATRREKDDIEGNKARSPMTPVQNQLAVLTRVETVEIPAMWSLPAPIQMKLMKSLALCVHGGPVSMCSVEGRRKSVGTGQEGEGEISRTVHYPIFGQTMTLSGQEFHLGSGDSPSMAAAVTAVRGGVSKLGTKHWVLQQMYSQSQIVLCTEFFLSDANVPIGTVAEWSCEVGIQWFGSGLLKVQPDQGL